jgi:ABC-type multidrug transport system ATPase subunit
MLLDVKALGHRYRTDWVFRGLDLRIEAGRPVALVGANGAGKTTLFSLVCGYFRPTEGSILISGHPQGDTGTFGRLGALPQDAQLDPTQRLAETMVLFAQLQGYTSRQARLEITQLLRQVGLGDSGHLKPGELSHGMRKRAAIAQALIGRPPLVLLDEPTAGLDPQNARQLRSLIHSLADQTTFFISSHNLAELEELCDRILLLQNGRLEEHNHHDRPSDIQVLTVTFAHKAPDADDRIAATEPSIVSLTRIGDRQLRFDIKARNAHEAAEVLLKFLKNKGWTWLQLMQGVPLEHALYGESPSPETPGASGEERGA